MTERQVQNILNYLGAIGLAVLLAGGVVLQEQLAKGEMIDWTPIGAAALAALITALRASMLPKVGDEHKTPLTPEQFDQLVERLHPVVTQGVIAEMRATPSRDKG